MSEIGIKFKLLDKADKDTGVISFTLLDASGISIKDL
jgi:hypothetical protein